MDDSTRNQSGEAIAATQQSDQAPPSNLEDVGAYGTQAEAGPGSLGGDEGPINTATGFSAGGTGSSIERGVDATLGAGEPNEVMTSEVYDEAKADLDFDPDSDDLGMGQDDV